MSASLLRFFYFLGIHQHEVMGQKRDKGIEKEETLSEPFNDYEILNKEEEHFNSSGSRAHQIFSNSDTSPQKDCPGLEPKRPNDNGEPLLNQGGKKISWSYDTNVSQNARTPNPQLSPAGGPCALELETLINYTTAKDREGISSAVDQQHAYKTKGMTNKTHPRGSREMLEGPRPGNSKEVVKCVEKNETWTNYDTGAKEKMKDDMGIKRTPLEKHPKKQLENAELLESKSVQEEEKDKRFKDSQTSHEFDQIICDQGWTGRVQQKESNTDRLENLKTDNSLNLETVTTECPLITGLHSYSTTDSMTGQTDLGFQRDRNISSVSPSVTDMSTCVLKEPNGAREACSNFTTTHERSFEIDRRDRTFHASLPMLRGDESISHECSRSEDLDVDDGNAVKASLQREKEPLHFTAVITPPPQIHTFPDQRAKISSDISHLYVPQAEIQSIIPDILSTNPQADKKTKGPPPPVPKKPKNPFKKGRKGSASHSIDEPGEYSDLLLKNIKMGRRQAALESIEDFNRHPSCLDMLPYMSKENNVPRHCLVFYDELVAKDFDKSTATGEDPREDELKDLSMSQLRPLLERKAKIKGPPPAVPKKPLNPFRETDVVKISGNMDYSSKCGQPDSENYMNIVDEDESTSPMMPNRHSHLACRMSRRDSSGSEEDELSRFRPVAELIRDTNKIQEKVIRHSRTNIMEARPDVTVGSQSLKVSEMKTAFDVKKAQNNIERRSSPKREHKRR